jgi:hypothetical protein
MKNISDTQKAESVVALAFQYDEIGELVKPHLLVNEEEEVEISPLSPEEEEQRAEFEKDIHDGLEAFGAVGYSLHQIKTLNLFRSTHRSFEKYCKDKWGISRVHANRKIEAYRTQELLKSEPKGSVSIPEKETHARVLAECTPEEKVKVAREVKEKVGDGKPTGKHWKETKEAVVPSKTSKKASAVNKLEAKEIKGPVESSNVVPISAAPAASDKASLISPAEFHQGVKLTLLTTLSEMATKLYNIGWDSTRKEEREKLVLGLHKGLPFYAEWEQECLVSGNPTKKEAA